MEFGDWVWEDRVRMGIMSQSAAKDQAAQIEDDMRWELCFALERFENYGR